jgi:hypothetical protein
MLSTEITSTLSLPGGPPFGPGGAAAAGAEAVFAGAASGAALPAPGRSGAAAPVSAGAGAAPLGTPFGCEPVPSREQPAAARSAATAAPAHLAAPAPRRAAGPSIRRDVHLGERALRMRPSYPESASSAKSVQPPRLPVCWRWMSALASKAPPLPQAARAGARPVHAQGLGEHPPTQPRCAPEPPPPPPRAGEHVSQALKDHITDMALGLLEEQLQARIVHYRADLATNPELDAVTAEVVEELRRLQAAAAAERAAAGDREAIRASHERALRGLLDRIFPPGALSLLVERRLKQIHKSLARLFFQSELHEKTRGRDGAAKVIQHGEQAIYYLLTRYKNRLEAELSGFDFASEEVRERSFDLLAKMTKDMQDAFLSRRSSELKRIVRVFHGVLVEFFGKRLPPSLGELAAQIVERAHTWEGRAYPYKIAAEAFPRFRASFERCFMERLVGAVEDPLVAQLADTAGAAREETLQFITDPHIFSTICGELCDGVYEFLCNEGYLDLPPDWRVLPQASQGG